MYYNGVNVPGYDVKDRCRSQGSKFRVKDSKLISVDVLVVFSTYLITTSGDVERQWDEREPVNVDNIDGRYAYRRTYCSGYQACHLQAWKDVTA